MPTDTQTGTDGGGEPLSLNRIKDAISYHAHGCVDGFAKVSVSRLLEWRHGLSAALTAKGTGEAEIIARLRSGRLMICEGQGDPTSDGCGGKGYTGAAGQEPCRHCFGAGVMTEELRAALAQSAGQGRAEPVAGWRLVPERPTEEMLSATRSGYWHLGAKQYERLLAAAPTPPAPDAGAEGAGDLPWLEQRLPEDVDLGGCTFRKGVQIGVLVRAARRHYQDAKAAFLERSNQGDATRAALKADLGEPFMTCRAGDGRPHVRLEYRDLHDAQRAHAALVHLLNSPPAHDGKPAERPMPYSLKPTGGGYGYTALFVGDGQILIRSDPETVRRYLAAIGAPADRDGKGGSDA